MLLWCCDVCIDVLIVLVLLECGCDDSVCVGVIMALV